MKSEATNPRCETRVLFLSPEVVPFAKTGGLADVAGALPPALKRLGVDVTVVLPFYRTVQKGNFKAQLVFKNVNIPLGGEKIPVNFLESKTDERVRVYFIEREDMYDRSNLYGNDSGAYYDNLERFTCFSHAALKLRELLSDKPDLIHCHDWQTGLVPALANGPYRTKGSFSNTPTVFTVHNLGYQGDFPQEKLPLTGLSREDFFHPEGLEYWGKISFLKAGLVYSQAITTVSPTYAKEIQTPECGMGMEGVLRRRRNVLYGILNGVDYNAWDPAKDPHIIAPYSPGQMAGKRRCKEALIEEKGLNPSLRNRPLLGIVSRLDSQKGLDLLVQILSDLLAQDVALVILGSGDERIQKALQEAAFANPGRVGLEMGFNEPLAHRIMAGADILLIPSRYEPCGLTQMYALKYGTVPVVRATGGLEDTIESFDSQKGQGNGFKFRFYEARDFLASIRQALQCFEYPNVWKKLIRNGMGKDFSWDRSARSYVEVYNAVLGK